MGVLSSMEAMMRVQTQRNLVLRLTALALSIIPVQVSVTIAHAAVAKHTLITSTELSLLPADNSCHAYCITGVCLWLKCGWGCRVETSTRIQHRNPDVVVTTYDQVGESPWVEYRTLLAPLQISTLAALMSATTKTIPGGGQQSVGKATSKQALRFKEADAVGHPKLLPMSLLSDVFCGSQATPYQPYFSSAMDALTWRLGGPEYLYVMNLVPGVREIGRWPFNSWGGLFPRTGFVMQNEDPKASAIVAQRVGNIVTQSLQPHVYLSLSGTPMDGKHYFKIPKEVKENKANTGVWQMNAPTRETSCQVFGKFDGPLSMNWSNSSRTSEDNKAVWSLWRPYECCERKGQVYLGTVPMMVCLPGVI